MGRSSDLGKLLLRITVAGLMIGHGIHKIQHGIGGADGIPGMVEGKGLPAFVAYGVYVGEVLAPLLLIVGFWTRCAALALVINMCVAIWLRHMDQLTLISDKGAPVLELQFFYLLSALSIVLIGPGRFALDGRQPKAG